MSVMCYTHIILSVGIKKLGRKIMLKLFLSNFVDVKVVRTLVEYLEEL